MFSIPFLTDGSSFKSSVVRTVNALITENKRLNNEIENLKRVRPSIQNFITTTGGGQLPYCGSFDVQITSRTGVGNLPLIKIFDSSAPESASAGKLVGYGQQKFSVPNFSYPTPLYPGFKYVFLLRITWQNSTISGLTQHIYTPDQTTPGWLDNYCVPVLVFEYQGGKINILWRASYNTPIFVQNPAYTGA